MNVTRSNGIASKTRRTLPDLIEYTEDLSKLKFNPENRPIDWAHVSKLVEAIYQNNLLREFPVVILKDGTILDGQHRVKAAEQLGLGVWYITSGKLDSMGQVAEIQSSTKAWTLNDYLHRFVKAGNPEYVKLRHFVNNYEWISTNVCIRLCYTGPARSINELFKSGNYICNDMEFAKEVAEAAYDFEPHFKYYASQSFVMAISNLTANAVYDHDRMMQKMAYQSSKLVRCPGAESYIDVLNGIYNHKVRKGEYVHLRQLRPNDPQYRPNLKRG